MLEIFKASGEILKHQGNFFKHQGPLALLYSWGEHWVEGIWFLRGSDIKCLHDIFSVHVIHIDRNFFTSYFFQTKVVWRNGYVHTQCMSILSRAFCETQSQKSSPGKEIRTITLQLTFNLKSLVKCRCNLIRTEPSPFGNIGPWGQNLYCRMIYNEPNSAKSCCNISFKIVGKILMNIVHNQGLHHW